MSFRDERGGSLDEAQLVQRARAGDCHCLNILFDMHYKMVFGYLIKLCGNVHLAEDLVQESLLKATLNIKTFRGDCKFSTYLIQIATNCYKNEVRKQSRMIYDDEAIKHLSSNAEHEAVTQLQFKEALDALQDMSEEQRMSFILRHYYGYSIEEISTYFNVPQGTTKSRIYNVIQLMRKKLFD